MGQFGFVVPGGRVKSDAVIINQKRRNNADSKKIFSFVLFFISISILGQIGSTIPNSRKVNWQTVGYERGTQNPELVTVGTTLYVVAPKNKPNYDDWTSVQTKIWEAQNWTSTHSDFAVVQLAIGTYNIVKRLAIKGDRIILRGSGNSTILKMGNRIDSGDYWPEIHIYGELATSSYEIDLSNYSGNQLTLDSTGISLNSNDFINIYLPNGDWQNEANDNANGTNPGPDNYLGQIVQVQSYSSGVITAKDDVELALSFATDQNSTAYVQKITRPAQKVGFESFKIISSSSGVSKIPATHFKFIVATNCWMRNITSVTPRQNHVSIDKSTAVDIKQCLFDDAQNWGGGGYGYGVVLHGHSTNCLIEDNIFVHLRHSIIFGYGANKNVIAYNYSREQHDELGLYKEDISLHGHYSFANLFEGNRVDRFGADLYWGKNGPFNTFFRNYSYYSTSSQYYGMMKMEWERDSKEDPSIHIDGDNRYNILGNEAKLYSVENNAITNPQQYAPSDVLEFYGILNTLSYIKISHHYWNTSFENYFYLPDISYYLSAKSSFLDGYSWPPIGPRIYPYGSMTSQDIPARERWCLANPGQCSGLSKIFDNDQAEFGTELKYEYKLYNAFPNPFNPTTVINYELKENGLVSLKVYDILGREIAELVNDNQSAGFYSVKFDATNLASGLYIYRLTAHNFVKSKKMLLSK